MKKKVNFNKEIIRDHSQPFLDVQSYSYRKLGLKGLGGISLYNEQYQRHLEKIKNPNANATISQSQIQQQTQRGKSNKTLQDLFDQEYYQECEINDFMHGREKEQRHQQKYNIAHEIQDIISNLKISQHTTANLLEQIQKQKNFEEYKSFQNFNDLIEFYNSHNKQSFANLLARIFEQLKKKMNHQILKVKKQYEQKIKLKCRIMVDRQIQHNSRNVQVQLMTLRKQLKTKEIQYNVLYDFKRRMLQRRDTYLSNMVLQQKIQEVNKLQEENKSKSMEIKRLQKQVDCFQDKFFNKIIQNQRKTSSLFFKSELQSIIEDQDGFKGRIKQKNRNILRKSNNKQRLSRLSLGNDLIANKVMEYITSAFEINDKPRSLKEMPNHMFNDFDSQLSLDQPRSPKKFIQKKTLKKIIDKYQSKDKVKKSSLRKNGQPKPLRNQSVKVISSEKSMKQKKSNLSLDRQIKVKIAERKASGPNLSQEAIPTHMKTMLNLKTKERISQNQQKDRPKERQQDYRKQTEDYNFTNNFCSTKVIKSDNPMKKIKKGVSFQIDDIMGRSSLKITKQINYCYQPTKMSRQASQKMTATPQTMDNQEIKFIDATNKFKQDKSKLFKVKPKEKKHFKAASFQNNSINEKQLKKQTAKERHTAIDKIRVRSIAKFGSIDRMSFKEQGSQQIAFQEGQAHQRATISFQLQGHEQQVFDQNVKKMILRCKSKDKFYSTLLRFHKECGENCQHIKKYMQMFDKLKSKQIRQTVKLNCQNLNKHIRKSSQIYIHQSKVGSANSKHLKEQTLL